MIIVNSKKEGFRRAGIAHPARPVQYSNDAFTADQLKILKAEPMLQVQEIPDPPPPSPEDDKTDKGGAAKSEQTGGKAKSPEGKAKK